MLVDHGEAIPSGIAVDSVTANQLARLAHQDVSRDEEHAAVQSLRQAASEFDQVDLGKVKDASLAALWGGETLFGECCRFLEDRRDHLDALMVGLFDGKQPGLPSHGALL